MRPFVTGLLDELTKLGGIDIDAPEAPKPSAVRTPGPRPSRPLGTPSPEPIVIKGSAPPKPMVIKGRAGLTTLKPPKDYVPALVGEHPALGSTGKPWQTERDVYNNPEIQRQKRDMMSPEPMANEGFLGHVAKGVSGYFNMKPGIVQNEDNPPPPQAHTPKVPGESSQVMKARNVESGVRTPKIHGVGAHGPLSPEMRAQGKVRTI